MINSVSGMMSGMPGMTAMSRPPQPPSSEELYSELDTNADGALSTDELQAMSDELAERMGDDAPTVDDLMARLDGDGDGALSFAEFEAGRPDGPPPGAQGGMMPPGMNGAGGGGQLDLAQLFSTGEEQDEQTTTLADWLV